MTRNKDRLYLALYSRDVSPRLPGGEDAYHWAFNIGPKLVNDDSLGLRIHVRESLLLSPAADEGGDETTLTPSGASASQAANPDAAPAPGNTLRWELKYEEVPITWTLGPGSLMVRVLVGKVRSGERLREVLAGVPVPAPAAVGDDAGDPGRSCVAWTAAALGAALADGRALGRSIGAAAGWPAARDRAMWYAGAKRAQRRSTGWAAFAPASIPTWDMLAGTEVVG
ncbi:hypothetical protein GGS23DRAFT_606178 [Durotheca rogersii]|uniref:uncharacterized protein n=1 Tax=Durotheca rogersii TaxID=419775 RepID=UPI00221F5770|nr:uncharacterized protein GGS23DRAFT_606178 [Durotheca rogersii]KAI5861615.1 hypothetical protein GGS23DRAFT_606178 [Durotheca rogersii]